MYYINYIYKELIEWIGRCNTLVQALPLNVDRNFRLQQLNVRRPAKPSNPDPWGLDLSPIVEPPPHAVTASPKDPLEVWNNIFIFLSVLPYECLSQEKIDINALIPEKLDQAELKKAREMYKDQDDFYFV